MHLYQTCRRIPIIGKHTKKITCAAWNKDSILVLASEDKTLSINNSEGDTLRIITLRDVPNELQFSEMKTDERVAGENTVCIAVFFIYRPLPILIIISLKNELLSTHMLATSL